MRTFCFVVAVVAAATAVTNALGAPSLLDQPPYSVNQDTNMFIDADGREIFMHGMNVVVKSAPYLPETSTWNPNTSFVEKDMAMLQSLGMNVIRLSAMWPGVEPTERGPYNESYVAALHAIVTKAAGFGIHSFLDRHQDDMSMRTCGEGFPAWLKMTNVTNFPWPIKSPWKNIPADGIPTPAQCAEVDWPELYVSEAEADSWSNFWNKTDPFGIRGKFIRSWAFVVDFFANKAPSRVGAALLGYEILNEPFAGSMYRKGPGIMIPGVADRENLQPLYDEWAAAIRPLDPHRIVMMEPVTWTWWGPGFTHVPGGRDGSVVWGNATAISSHFYTPPDIPGAGMDFEFAMIMKKRKQLGCGAFLTEFGFSANSKTKEPSVDVMDAADKYLFSGWSAWDFKPMQGPKTGYGWAFWNPDGTPNHAKRKLASRTYPQAVAGFTQKIFFNTTSAHFVLRFAVNPKVTNPNTEIYYNAQYWYPTGVAVSATAASTGSAQLPVNISSTHVTVRTPRTLPAGDVVTVTLDA